MRKRQRGLKMSTGDSLEPSLSGSVEEVVLVQRQQDAEIHTSYLIAATLSTTLHSVNNGVSRCFATQIHFCHFDCSTCNPQDKISRCHVRHKMSQQKTEHLRENVQTMMLRLLIADPVQLFTDHLYAILALRPQQNSCYAMAMAAILRTSPKPIEHQSRYVSGSQLNCRPHQQNENGRDRMLQQALGDRDCIRHSVTRDASYISNSQQQHNSEH